MKVGALAGLFVVLPGCDILFQLKDVHGEPAIDAAPDTGCGAPDEDGDCIAGGTWTSGGHVGVDGG